MIVAGRSQHLLELNQWGACLKRLEPLHKQADGQEAVVSCEGSRTLAGCCTLRIREGSCWANCKPHIAYGHNNLQCQRASDPNTS